jgi:hypothetical protein
MDGCIITGAARPTSDIGFVGGALNELAEMQNDFTAGWRSENTKRPDAVSGLFVVAQFTTEEW